MSKLDMHHTCDQEEGRAAGSTAPRATTPMELLTRFAHEGADTSREPHHRKLVSSADMAVVMRLELHGAACNRVASSSYRPLAGEVFLRRGHPSADVKVFLRRESCVVLGSFFDESFFCVGRLSASSGSSALARSSASGRSSAAGRGLSTASGRRLASGSSAASRGLSSASRGLASGLSSASCRLSAGGLSASCRRLSTSSGRGLASSRSSALGRRLSSTGRRLATGRLSSSSGCSAAT